MGSEINQPSDHKPSCRKSSSYMMRYMDGTINKTEAEWLNKHVSECDECMESFKIYDMMMNEFAETELIATPDDFVDRVMAAVNELPAASRNIAASLDNIIYAVWGVFSIIFGFGFLLFMNREQIMLSMEGNEAFAAYLRVISPVSTYVTDFVNSLQTVFSSAMASVTSFISSYSYLLLGIAAACAVIQYVLKTRKGNLDVVYAEEKFEQK